MHDVIVVDEDFSESASRTQAAAEQIESILDRYLDIMKTASSAGAVSGEAAEALRSYVAEAEGLRGIVSKTDASHSAAIRSFLSRIDEADSFLY